MSVSFRITFESELTELEAAFGRIIARLCKIILDVIGYETTLANENTDQESSHKTDRLQTTLDRLSDQFQSVVELSAKSASTVRICRVYTKHVDIWRWPDGSEPGTAWIRER